MSADIEAKLAELVGPVLAPLSKEERPVPNWKRPALRCSMR